MVENCRKLCSFAGTIEGDPVENLGIIGGGEEGWMFMGSVGKGQVGSIGRELLFHII